MAKEPMVFTAGPGSWERMREFGRICQDVQREAEVFDARVKQMIDGERCMACSGAGFAPVADQSQIHCAHLGPCACPASFVTDIRLVSCEYCRGTGVGG